MNVENQRNPTVDREGIMTSGPVGKLYENTANTTIAEWLNTIGMNWQANGGERTRTLQGRPSEHPDIIITEGDRMPVIIECEWSSNTNPGVEDAKKRIGEKMVGESREFTEAIAVGIEEKCRQDSNVQFRRRLENNEAIMTVQLVSRTKEGTRVWPAKPLLARPSDLVAYCEYAQVPQTVIEEQSSRIAERIQSVGLQLSQSILATVQGTETIAKLRSVTGAEHKSKEQDDRSVCPVQCQHDRAATQTTCAIWLVAIDLQNDLSQYSPAMREKDLQTTHGLKSAAISGKLTAQGLLGQWKIIKDVNYLPVIELAIDALESGPMGNAISDVLEELHDLSVEMNALHAKHIYNFAGELWQKLVTDREERAAHYTKPEIAELLATLAAERFDNLTAEELAVLNLMDAACGTGTLVGAGERALRRKYRAKGGDDEELHRKRMQEHIYAMDVNGIAGTLTAKRLTDMNVEQDYSGSKIAAIKDPAGSLTLMDPRVTGISRVLGYQGVTPTPGIGGREDQGVFHVMLEGIQWTLMNPPYARPRKGRKQATRGLERPREAAGKANYKMSHGQAGLATDFGDLCNIRLAPGGVYSNVLPLTAAHAGTWKGWRAELEKDFQSILVIANTSQSMSSDTNMSEMLVVATKKEKRPGKWTETELLCVNLSVKLKTLAEGYAIAREIAAIDRQSDHGALTHGIYTWMTQTKAGEPWGAVGNSSNDLNEVIAALLEGKAFDPLTLETHELVLPMATLGDIAETGPTHDLIGHPKGGDGRGAFEWTPLKDLSAKPAQQSMWAADSKVQTSINTKPTHGASKTTDKDSAKQMAQMRGKWHLNRNLALSSQGLAMAKTGAPVHGGRAWNALQGISDDSARCITLFYNSTPGVILMRAYGQKGQRGPRAAVQVGAIPGLPCPAFGTDTPEAQAARQIAKENFGRLANLKLEPFAYCFQDENRRAIDNVVAEMLGLDPDDEEIQQMLDYYRIMFASEPSVNGGQKKIVAALEKHRGNNEGS